MNRPEHMLRNQGATAVPQSDTVLIGSNPRRWCIVISSPNTGRITIGFAGIEALDAGITLYAGQLPLILGYDEVGDSLHEEIHAISSVTSAVIGWMEFFG